jgi:ELWxxDGT repeat protein
MILSIRLCATALLCAGLMRSPVPGIAQNAGVSQATLIADIAREPEARSSECSGFEQQLGLLPSGVVLLRASTPATGCELWRSDGTPEGTQLLRDIWPGDVGGLTGLNGGVIIGDALLFVANDGNGSALWRTDGSAVGTRLVHEICPGVCLNIMSTLHPLGNKVVFSSRNDFAPGASVWVSDGTAAGTQQISAAFERADGFTNFRGKAYFLCGLSDGQNNIELCVTDGTATGTALHKEIRSGSEGSAIVRLHALTNALIFIADDGVNGSELWMTDGVETKLLKDINPGAAGSSINEIDVLVPNLKAPLPRKTIALFAATTVANGHELWWSDGTEAGTTIVGDFVAGAGSSDPSVIDVIDNIALVTVRTPTTGREPLLVRSTGTIVGAIADIRPGTGSSNPESIGALGTNFYVAADDGVNGRELWKVPTTSGVAPSLVADLTPGPLSTSFNTLGPQAALPGKLFFAAATVNAGAEIFLSDGSAAGTSLLLDIRPGNATSLAPVRPAINTGTGTLIFRADDGVSGSELWRTDGTSGGTELLKNIAADVPGLYQRGPLHALPNGGALAYACTGPSEPEPPATPLCHVYGTQGTAATTQALAAFDEASFAPGEVAELPNGLLFLAYQQANGTDRVWRSDGSVAGTRPLEGLTQLAAAAGATGKPLTPVRIGDAVYIRYDNSRTGPVFRTDGINTSIHLNSHLFSLQDGSQVDGAYLSVGEPKFTLFRSTLALSPTQTVTQLPLNGNIMSSARVMSAGPNRMFIAIDLGKRIGPRFDAEINYELWVSDGTSGGTRLVKKFVELLRPHVALDGAVYFAADDAGGNVELWKSDGSAAGTVRVRDVLPGAPASMPSDLTLHNGKLYFSATGADRRRLLYVSDGSEAGTKPVRDDVDAPLMPVELRTTRDGIFFSAADAAHGRELWRSDGTAAGTQLVTDIAPGPANSNPLGMAADNSKLYLNAYTDAVGEELWGVPLAAVTTNPLPRKLFLPLSSRT